MTTKTQSDSVNAETAPAGKDQVVTTRRAFKEMNDAADRAIDEQTRGRMASQRK